MNFKPVVACVFGSIFALAIVFSLIFGRDVPVGYCDKAYNPQSAACANH